MNSGIGLMKKINNFPMRLKLLKNQAKLLEPENSINEVERALDTDYWKQSGPRGRENSNLYKRHHK